MIGHLLSCRQHVMWSDELGTPLAITLQQQLHLEDLAQILGICGSCRDAFLLSAICLSGHALWAFWQVSGLAPGQYSMLFNIACLFHDSVRSSSFEGILRQLKKVTNH